MLNFFTYAILAPPTSFGICETYIQKLMKVPIYKEVRTVACFTIPLMNLSHPDNLKEIIAVFNIPILFEFFSAKCRLTVQI